MSENNPIVAQLLVGSAVFAGALVISRAVDRYINHKETKAELRRELTPVKFLK